MSDTHNSSPNTPDPRNRPSRPPRRRSLPTSEHEAAFGTWWATYPRKRDRGAARRAYAVALRQASPDEIAAALADALPEWRTRENQFIPYPASWLKSQLWSETPVADRTWEWTTTTTTTTTTVPVLGRDTTRRGTPAVVEVTPTGTPARDVPRGLVADVRDVLRGHGVDADLDAIAFTLMPLIPWKLGGCL